MSEVLKHSAINEFTGIPESVKNQTIRNTNIGIYYSCQNPDGLSNILKELKLLGFIPLNFKDVLSCLYLVCRSKGLDLNDISSAKSIADQLNRIRIVPQNNTLKFAYQDGESEIPINIGNLTWQDAEYLKSFIENRGGDNPIFFAVIDKIKEFLKRQRSIIYYSTNYFNYLPVNGPLILISGDPDKDKRPYFFRKIKNDDPNAVKRQVLESVLSDAGYRRKRELVRESLITGELNLFPRFGIKNLPQDPLIQQVRNALVPMLEEFLRDHQDHPLDPIDLKYQILFRLTSLDIEEIFSNGLLLRKYLEELNVFSDWRNIPFISGDYLNQFQLREDTLRQVIEEQYRIIRNRLKQSDLPLQNILRARKYSKDDWKVEVGSNRLRLVNRSKPDETPIDLIFGEVDNDFAQKVFRDLHYIHHPISDFSLGLFEQGDNIPLSIIGISQDISPSRQNILLAYGFDPDMCLYFSRMYHRLEAPFNLSSAMLSLAIKYLRKVKPETQAVFTAFMPSFASGKSMTSAGFDRPISMRSHKLFFMTANVDGEDLIRYESEKNQDAKVATNKIPILPSILLLKQINKPTYQPLLELENFIIVH